jgi:hypothetical protein
MEVQVYLNEIRNPFNQIMGNEFPESHWKSWDTVLMSRLDRMDEGDKGIERIVGYRELPA